MASSLFSTLNPQQAEAVETVDRPLLVLAGAGTGKTRVLTTRMAFLMECGMPPDKIVGVTFTQKAAAEMRLRLQSLAPQQADRLNIGTFHHIFLKMLRRHGSLTYLSSDFSILDQSDAKHMIQKLIKKTGVSLDPATLMGSINYWKDRGLNTQQAQDNPSNFPKECLTFYRLYQENLKNLNAIDFNDILLLSLHLLKENPSLLAFYRSTWQAISVDEYQDVNVCQYLLLMLLSKDSPFFCCVGDDDQSVYGWRGAEVEHILRFEKDFPDAKIVRLEKNYRSSGHILGAACSLITKNLRRYPKTLTSTSEEWGAQVHVQAVLDPSMEAQWIVDKLKVLDIQKTSCAILIRTTAQSREIEEALMRHNLPYVVIGGMRFYERLEVKDMMAYLRIAYRPDDSLAFERVINTPRRGLGPAVLAALYARAAKEGVSLWWAAHCALQEGLLRPSAAKSLELFMKDIESWRALASELTPYQLALHLFEESGYEAFLKKTPSTENLVRHENIQELLATLKNVDSLKEFIENFSIASQRHHDGNTTQRFVVLMTLHTSKGLEYDHVFLPGWEEGLFPHTRCLNDPGGRGLEEERRLAYVGMTRAKTGLFISFVRHRMSFKGGWQSVMPSRFLGEIDTYHLHRKTL